MATDLPLGKPTSYPRVYSPDLLVGIPRSDGRASLKLEGTPPFDGIDIWNAYEVSWLDARGKPVVAVAQLRIPAHSPRIVESKSLKLYLNSLNGSRHDSAQAVRDTIAADVERTVGAPLQIDVSPLTELGTRSIGLPEGECIDGQGVEIDTYDLNSGLLEGSTSEGAEVTETLHSNLLKSNCPITGQPDWATLLIRYRGAAIDHTSLLRYIVSYRNHDDFHEHCVERIFADLQHHCRPAALTVFARYSRRGGIDINPFRSDWESSTDWGRLWRQ